MQKILLFGVLLLNSVGLSMHYTGIDKVKLYSFARADEYQGFESYLDTRNLAPNQRLDLIEELRRMNKSQQKEKMIFLLEKCSKKTYEHNKKAISA